MQYAYDEDSLTGLDTAKRGSGAKGRRVPGGRKWTGDLRQRGRTARGLPQAVFKISSYSHNSGAVWDRVNYVGRDGELEVETANGETLSQVELEQMVEDWSGETEKRVNRQLAMSAVVSFPAGVDQEQATEAARQFFAAAFGENHDYIFAGHTDTKNFHVHVVVEAAGHDGKQLRIQRDDIQDLRMMFADKAHEQGIELDASPRWARGLGAARQPGPEIEGIERRGDVPVLSPEASGGQGWSPELELAAASRLTADRRVQLEALVEVRVGRDPEAKAAPTPLEYARAGEIVAEKIGGLENNREKVAAIEGAATLAKFGWQMTYQSHDKTEDIERARDIIAGVDKAINSQINGLSDGAAQKKAITAHRGLSDKLSDYRREQRQQAAQERAAGPENGPQQAGAGVEDRRESTPPGRECQALEYAQASAAVAGRIDELASDREKLAGVKGAVQLARFGWELAQRGGDKAEEREQARGMIERAERALRDGINQIDDPQAKQEAIQARQALYNDGVKEYRAEKREQERAERSAEEARDTGWGR